MASNLRLKSNVYIRKTDGTLRDDHDFVRQVRGLPAVTKLLAIFGLAPDDMRYESNAVRNLLRRGLITNSQHNMLRWGRRCLDCDSVPVGMTFAGELESRCEKQGCSISALQAKRLLLPHDVVMQFRSDLRAEETVAKAIEELHGIPPRPDPGGGPRTAVVVRVDATTAWTYSDDELSAFLLHGLRKRDHRTPHA